MSIVLSHTTAKAVYQAAHSVSAKDIESCSPVAIYGSCPTGALLSPTSTQQGESIPCICHVVAISNSK